MGIPEMLASSPDSGGMEGFFNSPIAMILMPRTAARFQAAKKDQMLLEQYNRKVQLAGQFADQIESKDPMAAAMIRADPSTMDNVFSAYYGAQKAQDLAKTNFGYDIAKQQNQAELTQAQKDRELNSPGGMGYYNKMMDGVVKNVVTDLTQGPNMPGMPTAGQVAAKEITPQEMTMAIRKDYNLPELGLGDVTRIMTDPKAIQDIRTTNISQQNANTTAQSANTADQRLEFDAAKNADDLASKTQDMLGPDNKAHRYGYNARTQRFDVDMGLVPPAARNQPITMFDPVDGKNYLWSVDPTTGQPDKRIGQAAVRNMVAMKNDAGEIIGWTEGSAAGGKKDQRSETLLKGDSIWEGSKDQFKTAVEGFDELSNFRNTTAGVMGTVGRVWRTDKGQRAADALEQLGTNYIYALSGQQAPKQEVDNFLNRITPLPTDGPETLKGKKSLIYSAMRAIKTRTSEGLNDKDRITPSAAVSSLSDAPPPPPQEFLDKGYTKEQWESLDPSDWAAFLEEDN